MDSVKRKISRVIVTGGTGLTGNALVRYLMSVGIHVTALVRPNSTRLSALPSGEGITVVPCEMGNYGKLVLPSDQYDAFFHLAWDGSLGAAKVNNRNNFYLQNNNVKFALDAVELCNRIGCPVFIMTGSQAEYGRKSNPVREDMVKNPENGYGMAKLCAEGMTRLMCHNYGIIHVWPILFSVYGPHDGAHSLIDMTVRNLLSGKTLPYTAGEQQWDYLYSFDAARALLKLAEMGKDGESYNVAQGKTVSIRECIETIYEKLSPEKEIRLGELPYADNQLMLLAADISKLQECTGFVPQFSFSDGIDEIIKSLKYGDNYDLAARTH